MTEDQKKAVVESMCLTYRHDFGLERENYSPFACGMTEMEREALRMSMRQILEHDVMPLIAQAVAEEREACAQVAASHGMENLKVAFIVRDIRARGKENGG